MFCFRVKLVDGVLITSHDVLLRHHPWQHVVEAQAVTHPCVPICPHSLAVGETNENNIQLRTFCILYVKKCP
jgi:hypothetical protein